MKKEIISFLKPRLALLLAVAMLISMMPLSAFAAETTAPETTWESQVTGSFKEAASNLESYTHYSVVDGEAVPETVTIDTTATLGSKENPIAISSPEELILFGQTAAGGYAATSNPTYGKYYILTQDTYDMGAHSMLALSASVYYPSGGISYFGFYGTLIGNGATICNANIVDGTRTMNYSNVKIQPALFSALNGRIWDLTLDSCTVSGGSGAMGMLYAATNGLGQDAIINCNIIDGQFLPGSGISTISLLGSAAVNSQADVTLGCDYTLRSNLTLNSGETLTIPEGVTLTVPAGRTLTLFNGDSLVNNGTIVKEGTITCSAHNVDETTGICTGCGNTFVARVGQSYYATVSAAVNAANSCKGTVTVFKDATVTSFVNTYTSDEKVEVVDGATVTIADGGMLALTQRSNGIDGVVSEAEGYVAFSSASYGYVYCSLNDLMENCNYGYTVLATVNSDASISKAVAMSNSSRLTISEGVTVTLNKPLTLESGTSLINNGELLLAEGGSIVNNGGTVTCGETAKHSYAEGVCLICGQVCPHTGGTADCETLAVCTDCGLSYGDYGDHVFDVTTGSCTVCDVALAFTVTDAEGTVTYYADTNAEADTACAEITDAITDGCMVKLYSDVSGGQLSIMQKCTLDLNGHTITVSFNLYVAAEDVVLENGTVVCTNTSDTSGAIATLADSSVTIRNLTIRHPMGYGINLGAKLNIGDNCTITGEKADIFLVMGGMDYPSITGLGTPPQGEIYSVYSKQGRSFGYNLAEGSEKYFVSVAPGYAITVSGTFLCLAVCKHGSYAGVPVDNGDDTHCYVCSLCTAEISEAHIFDEQTNLCVCGAGKPYEGISVSGVQVNVINSADVLGDGTVSYDAATNTLTIRDNDNIGAVTVTDGTLAVYGDVVLYGDLIANSLELHDGATLVWGDGINVLIDSLSGTGTVINDGARVFEPTNQGVEILEHFHTKGAAVCNSRRICPDCGRFYGEVVDHVYDENGACVRCQRDDTWVVTYTSSNNWGNMVGNPEANPEHFPNYVLKGENLVLGALGTEDGFTLELRVYVDDEQIRDFTLVKDVLTVPADAITGEVRIDAYAYKVDDDVCIYYGVPVFTWEEDYSSASAAMYCADHWCEVTGECNVTTRTVQPTCAADGYLEYTATVTLDLNGIDKTFTDVKTVTLPRLEVHQTANQNGKCPLCGTTLYNIYLGGLQATGRNAADILGDGTASYDAATGTLTLNGATVDASALDVPALQITGGTLTLALQGTNALTGSVQVQSSTDEAGNTTWYGEPAISIAEGAALIITGDEAATLTLMGNDFAYSANDHIPSASSISGGSLSVAGGTITTNNGIRLTGDYSQTGGSVDAGFLEAQNVTVSDGILNTKAFSGIYPRYADSLAGSIHGIIANKAINISGGTVSTASGSVGHNGDYCGNTRVTGETITTHGLYALESVSITGGTVTSTGCYGRYVIDAFGFLVLGQYTEDDVTPSGPAPGSALEAPEWTIAEEATFICGSETSHRGGTATCSYKAVCHFCGEVYGETDTSNHDTVNAEYTNGFCDSCDAYEAAELVDGVYQIGNAGQLYWFAQKVNSGSRKLKAVLTDDITINENVLVDGELNPDTTVVNGFRTWTPIGNKTNYYSGSFDGQNHSISGLYYQGGDTYVGLFGDLTYDAAVKNLTLTDSCYNVDASGTSPFYAGGIAGILTVGSIENCRNEATLCVNYDYNASVGGIAGFVAANGTVSHCSNAGELHAINTSILHIGGIVGDTAGVITDCGNTGDMIVDNGVNTCVGGVSNGGTLKNCFSTGSFNVTSDVSYPGGISGSSATAVNCYYLTGIADGGIGGEDSEGAAQAMSPEAFASGEVAYLLNAGVTDGTQAWYQTIGTDATPVFSGETVYYGYTDCLDQTVGYGNDAVYKTIPTHVYSDNGFCTICGSYESAVQNDSGIYEISNAGQLYWFAQLVNGASADGTAQNTTANAILTADIDLENRFWYPIGVYQDPAVEGGADVTAQYGGTFDGNGHTVSNFTAEGNGSQGLLGYTGTAAVVKNLGVINATVSGWNAGAIMAYMGTVENCYAVDCTVTGSSSKDSGRVYVGAIAGTQQAKVNHSFAYRCTLIVAEGENATVGGIGGRTTTNCYYGNVTVANGEIRAADGETAMTQAQFASGEVAYLLGEAWGQNIEKDSLPILGGNTVYQVLDCDGKSTVYSNTDGNKPHSYIDSVCTVCGDICAHDWQWVQLETTHERTCSICAAHESGDHSDEEADHFCDSCGKQLSDHEVQAKVDWYLHEDSCYVNLTASCPGCDITVYDSGDATLTGSYEGTTCQDPSTVTYSFTYTYDGTEYTVTETLKTGTDPHTVFDGNGFCTSCGGYQKPTVDPGEDAEWDYDDVYLIYNAGQLYWFADHVNNVNNGITGKLMDDIDLNPGYTFNADGSYSFNGIEGPFAGGIAGLEPPRTWTPIGVGYPCYAGNFDGNGFTVSGAYAVSEGSYVGLFGNTDYNYTIENLGITNSYFKGADHVGGLIGYAYTTVKNCYVTDTVYVVGDYSTAGLVGYNGGEINNSYTMAGTLADGGSGSFYNCYYLADEDTDGYDGTTALTADQFASGEAAYLLQSGIQSEDVYDEEGNYVETVIPQIWGQTIGTDSYPILGGAKVCYGYTTCHPDQTAPIYSNDVNAKAEKPEHTQEPVCTQDQNDLTKHMTSYNCCGYLVIEDHSGNPCTGCGALSDLTITIDTGASVSMRDEDRDGYYEISTADELYAFAALVNAGHGGINGKLIANITVNENVLNEDGTLNQDAVGSFRTWRCIGDTFATRYSGIFDGNGKTVSGVYSTVGGLFGITTESFELYNLGLIASYISGEQQIGGIVNGNRGTITGCFNDGLVSGGYYVGGIVGSAFNTVKYCFFTGTVNAKGYAGGIVADTTEGSGIVMGCYNSGTINGTGYYCGGIVGYNLLQTITDCYNTGTVVGGTNVGGITGANFEVVSNCFNIGSVTCLEQNAGGIQGNSPNHGVTVNSYYLADSETDSLDGTTAVTAEKLASGEVAWLLQSQRETSVWGQTIGADSYPVLGGMEVYQVTNCKDEIAYSNTEESGAHIEQTVTGKAPTCTESGLTDGVICTVCGETLTAQEEISATGNHVDADNSGRCDTCNGLMQPAVLRKVSVSLKGNIALNYYMLLSDEVLSDETAYMQFTMADGEIIKIPVSQGVKHELDGESYCVFTCAVDAKEMTDTVISQFFYAGGVTREHSYSVQTYAKHILTSYDDAAVRDLITAMLNYGAASQLHFGYNTDRLANAELTAPDYTGVTIKGFDAVNGQGTELAKLYSTSLLLKSETTLRLFFRVDSSVENFTATYNGQALEVKQRSGLYYVDVVGISAKKLDENVTVSIHDGTNTAEVSFNPMSYCQGVLNDTTGAFGQDMKDLVAALYLYNQAANAYFDQA